MKRWVMLALLWEWTYSSCAEGCLRCGGESGCLICDSSRNFVLSGNACVVSTLVGCSQLQLDGGCLLCQAGHFLDPNSQNCVAVTKPLTKCLHYADANACLRCEAGAVLDPTTQECVAASPAVTNCELYDDQGVCALCASGFYPAVGGRSCLAAANSCALYSPLTCATCAPGFFFNPNIFLKALAGEAGPADEMFYGVLRGGGRPGLALSSACEPSALKNCRVAASSVACQTCESGYFLDELTKLCVAYPAPKIDNCQVYESATRCKVCANNFYLSGGGCTAVTPIDFCQTYDGSKETIICLSCSSAYFVSANTCASRTRTISNCAGYYKSKDLCETCAKGFTLTGDEMYCLTSIANCLTSQYSTSSGAPVAECLTCAPTFRLVSDKATDPTAACVAGNVENCIEYVDGDTNVSCIRCDSLSYIKRPENTCPKHMPIKNCLAYAQETPQECADCSESTAKFTFLNTCLPVNPALTNCVIFASPEACEKCASEYYLVSGACVKITLPNCLSASSATACTSCKAGFFLVNGECYEQELWISSSCQKVSSSSSGSPITQTLSCEGCLKGAMQFRLLTSFCSRETLMFRTGRPARVTNCLIYNTAGLCLTCSGGLFVSEDGLSCVDGSTCAKGRLPISLSSVPGSLYYLSGRNSCWKTASPTNCAAFGTSLNSGNSICSACKASFVAVIALGGNEYNIRGPFTTDASLVPTSRYYPISTCLESTSTDIQGPKDCTYYMVLAADTKKYCITCRWGTTRTPTTPSGGISRAYYSVACDAMSTCNNTVRYEGLDADANAIYSCHKCTSGLLMANVRVDSGRIVPQVGVATMTCEADSLAIANCLLHYKDYTDVAAPVIRCRLCATKYRYDSARNACVEVAQCKADLKDTWPGVCQTCSTGYAPLLDSNAVDFSTCVDGGDRAANCALLTGAVGARRCLLCRINYLPNADGVCESIRVRNCLDAQYSYQPPMPAAALPLAIWQTLVASTTPGFNGCSSCPSGFVSVMREELVCAASNYLGKLVPSTRYPSNCELFRFANEPLCLRCLSGFVRSQDSKKCISSSSANMPSCILANAAGSNCLECDGGFTLVGAACQQNNVPQCAEYTSAGEAVTCVRCSSGFALVSNRCQPGTVPNCRGYGEDPAKCEECATGYQLLVRSDQSTYCFPFEATALNCTSFDVDDFSSGELRCLNCAAGFAVTGTSPFVNTCLAFKTVPNCRTYDRSSLSAPGSLLCTHCNTGYFLSASACVASKVVPNCAEYKSKADGCLTCSTGFFLVEAGTCEPFPVGVAHCVAYTSMTSCSGCEPGFYLLSGECKAVAESALVANCQSYGSSATRCAVCKTGYFLSSNTCTKGTVENCATFTSASSCSVCVDKYYLSGTSCLPYPDSNCLNITKGACTACPEGLFPSGLECSIPSSPIPGCSLYSSATACAACEKGSYLVANKTKCLEDMQEFVDPNCLKTVMPSAYICSLCSPGFFFGANGCEACPPLNGCLQCDESGKACLVCDTNHFMDSLLNCVPIGNMTTTPNCTEFKNCTGKEILLALIALLMLITSL